MSFCSGSICRGKFIRQCTWIWKAIIGLTKCPSMKYFSKMYFQNGWITFQSASLSSRLSGERRRSRCWFLQLTHREIKGLQPSPRFWTAEEVDAEDQACCLLLVPLYLILTTFKVVSASLLFIGSPWIRSNKGLIDFWPGCDSAHSVSKMSIELIGTVKKFISEFPLILLAKWSTGFPSMLISFLLNRFIVYGYNCLQYPEV